MGRREQREQVFKLLFRVEFYAPEELLEQVRLFTEENEEIPLKKDADYVADRFAHIQEKLTEIDRQLNEQTKGWDTTRMGKVELTVLRLAVYEMLYDEEIPDSVAINEAVEIAKKYGQGSSGGFVNAVLAKFVKTGEKNS